MSKNYYNKAAKILAMQKQIPILFSTPMVQAILTGRKTQTRRVVKPQPWEEHYDVGVGMFNSSLVDKDGEEYPGPDTFGLICNDGEWCKKSPWKAGDVLWVRETHYAYGYWKETSKRGKKGQFKWEFVDMTDEMYTGYQYEDSKPDNVRTGISGYHGWYKRPSLFMPKEACRIWLQVTDVRVERLQDISEEDAKAEGVTVDAMDVDRFVFLRSAVAADDWFKQASDSQIAFANLWGSINGNESWNANPWVWVVSFKVLSTTGKPADL